MKRWGPAGQHRFSGCHTIWAWCLSSLVLSKDLVHIFFNDLECRCRGEGDRGGVSGCVERWSGWVCVGGGGFKSTIKLIHVISKLLINLSAGGWCLVVGDGFQTFPHLSWFIGIELISQVFSVGYFSHSDLLIQCVPDLIVQDTFPISLGILFDLTKMSEFCCKPWLIIVECQISPGRNAYILTETNLGYYGLCELVQIGGSSIKNAPISAVETGL